jgi:hypothetical protein
VQDVAGICCWQVMKRRSYFSRGSPRGESNSEQDRFDSLGAAAARHARGWATAVLTSRLLVWRARLIDSEGPKTRGAKGQQPDDESEAEPSHSSSVASCSFLPQVVTATAGMPPTRKGARGAHTPRAAHGLPVGPAGLDDTSISVDADG